MFALREVRATFDATHRFMGDKESDAREEGEKLLEKKQKGEEIENYWAENLFFSL